MEPLPAPTRHPLGELIETAFREARKSGLSISDAADIVAEVVRSKLDERVQDEAHINREMIHVQSIFGATSGLPLVDFKYGIEHFTLGVEEARDHALVVMQCAEAASQDAGMYRWLTLQMGMDARSAATAIGELRRFRGDLPKESWQTPAEQLAAERDRNER